MSPCSGFGSRLRRLLRFRLPNGSLERRAGLLQLASPFYFPDLLYRFTSDAIDLLVQVDGDADMVRDHADAVSYGELAARCLDESVLLVHFVEDAFRVFDHPPEAGFSSIRHTVRG